MGADKSLARPTSRCHTTESIVSLETGISSCADLQVFLVTDADMKHVGRRERFNNMETRAVKFSFPARQGAEGISRHSDSS